MKRILIMALSLAALTANAQKMVTQAIITTKTNMIVDETEEDIAEIGGGRGGGNFRFAGMDGENKIITYYKDSMSKTVMNTEMMNSSMITNNNTKVMTTLMQVMGRKMGFYINPSELAALGERRLDTMKAGPRKDSLIQRMENDKRRKTSIAYTEETKKIAGYNCKKAYVIVTNFLGQKDSTMLWYTPEIKFNGLSSTGNSSTFARAGGGGAASFDDINGFVMAYTQKMGAGRRMEIEVAKIELDKEVKAKEFEIPSDYDVKPMSEMRNMFGGGSGGGGQIRIQGRN